MKKISKNPLFWIGLVCLAIFFSNLSVIYVNIMEARNFISAREMLLYHNWLHTTMNLEPRYEKPPLPTWLTAFSAFLFGLKNLVALRLPAALSASLLIFTSYSFGKKFFDNKFQAFIASLVLATSFFIIFSGRNGQWDIFAHAFMMVGIYQFYLAVINKKIRWRYWLSAGLFFGLSFMSKGPVSFFALLLPFLLAYGLVYRFKGFNKTKWKPLLITVLIMLIIGLWWGIYIYLTDISSVKEIADKETVAWANRNVRPWYYYWSFPIQSGVWTIFGFISLAYPYLKKRVVNLNQYKFTLLWTLIAVVLLSLIPEKKPRYLLPVLIPLAFNISFLLNYIIQNAKKLNKVELFITRFSFGLIAFIALVFPIVGYLFFKQKLNGYWFYFLITSLILFCIGILIIKYLSNKDFKKVFFLVIAMMCTIVTTGLPLSKMFYDNNDFANISSLREIKGAQKVPLYMIGELTPELLWELGEPVKRFSTNKTFVQPKGKTFGLLLNGKIPEFLKKNYQIKFIKRFDINYISKNKRGYKTRLTRNFYILSKK